MNAARTILITGFEPFGGETVNASWEAARRLDGWRSGEFLAVARELPCAYDVSVREFVLALEALRPEAVLMTGQAGRRGLVSVERLARNFDDATAPDNRGALRRGVKISGDAPERLEAAAPAGKIAEAMRKAGIAARVSTNAGGFVCNHLYFGALRHLKEHAPATRAIFLHLPATPRQSPPGASANGSRRPTRRARSKPRRRR